MNQRSTLRLIGGIVRLHVKTSGISDQEMDGSAPVSAGPRSVNGGATLRVPAVPHIDSGMEHGSKSDVVPSQATPRAGMIDPRTAASRVVPVGSASLCDVATPSPSIRRSALADDAVTTVDGAFEALTREQHEALARRIRSELEHTRPLGTPPPSPVQSSVAPPGRTPAHPFKQTMMLGVARSPSSVPPAVLPATDTPVPEPPSLRASFVRVVGPPTAPPPRRVRRTGPPPVPERRSKAPERVPESEPEHEAFELDRRSGWNVTVNHAPPPAGPSASNETAGAVILPPPPSAADYEIASGESTARDTSTASSFPPAVIKPGLQQSGTVARPAHPDLLTQLPSVDPFAGFVARRPSFLERWLVVLVVALALVGAAALAAIALGYLGRPGG